MISAEALRKFFQRTPKSFLVMTRGTVFGASTHDTLPDANDYPYGMAADATDGVQFSQPDGIGGYVWEPVGGISQSEFGFNVRRYGALGNGAALDDDSFQAAATAARSAGRGTIIVPNGDYLLTQSIVLGSNITLALDDHAVLYFSDAAANTTCISAEGTATDPVALTSDVSPGDDEIAVASTSGMVVGGFLRLGSDLVFDSENTDSLVGEMVKIKGIAGLTVTLEVPTAAGYLVADNAVALPVAPVRNVRVRGGTILGPVAQVPLFGVGVRWGEHIFVEDVTFNRVHQRGVVLRDTVDARIFRNTFTHEISTNQAYGVSFTGACQDSRALFNYFEDVRHSLSTNNDTGEHGIPRRIAFEHNTIIDSAPTSAGQGSDAIDTHGAAEDIDILFNNVWGSSSMGINVECRSARVIGNRVRHCFDHGIYIHNETDFDGEVEVVGNEIRDVGQDGIRVTSGTRGTTATYRSLKVCDNDIAGAAAIGLHVLTSVTTADNRNADISGNIVDGRDDTTTATSGLVRIEGLHGGLVTRNQLMRVPYHGFRIADCDTLQITGNLISLITGSDSSAIYATDGASYLTIDQNVVESQSPSNSKGVTLEDDTSYCRVLRGNDFRQCTTPVAPGTGAGHSIDSERRETLTIASGAVTIRDSTTFLVVDTEGGAGTDDLDTINGGVAGQVLAISTSSSSRDVTLKDGSGNLRLAGDFLLSHADDTITLVLRTTTWHEVSRSDNNT